MFLLTNRITEKNVIINFCRVTIRHIVNDSHYVAYDTVSVNVISVNSLALFRPKPVIYYVFVFILLSTTYLSYINLFL